MTPDEAKQILLANRPDRPKSTDRRQLQKAIDIILRALDERTLGTWVDSSDTENAITCSRCGTVTQDKTKFCSCCGAYMGEWAYG